MKRMRMRVVTVLMVGAAFSLVVGGGVSNAAGGPINCTSAAALDVVPAAGGATYNVHDGAGWCLQGLPYSGDWSVTFSGSGSATSFSCRPGAGGTVSGLVLHMTLSFHNNRTGLNTLANETWTQIAPIAPYNLTAVSVSGGTQGLLENNIFNQCPPAGSPSSYIEWKDANAR